MPNGGSLGTSDPKRPPKLKPLPDVPLNTSFRTLDLIETPYLPRVPPPGRPSAHHLWAGGSRTQFWVPQSSQSSTATPAFRIFIILSWPLERWGYYFLSSYPSAQCRVWSMVRTSNCLLNGKIHEWLKDLSSPWWEWEEEEPSQGAHISRMGRV